MKVYGPSITNGTLCTDQTGGAGSCYGDSGGPLTINEGDQMVQIAIGSFVSTAGCDSAFFPHGYSRVTYFLEWIETHTGVAIRP